MSGFVLKLIALFSMLLDHIGYAFGFQLLRIPGRLSFPLFAFLCAEGWRHTGSKSKYVSRLLICAVVSAVPFSLMKAQPCSDAWISWNVTGWKIPVLLVYLISVFFLPAERKEKAVLLCASLIALLRISVGNLLILKEQQNVLYTLAYGALLCRIADLQMSGENGKNLVLLLVLAVCAPILYSFDYGILGGALILAFYLCKKREQSFLAAFLFALIQYRTDWKYVLGCLAGGVLLLCYNGKRGRENQRFFYWFYPAHLLLIWLCRELIQ